MILAIAALAFLDGGISQAKVTNNLQAIGRLNPPAIICQKETSYIDPKILVALDDGAKETGRFPMPNSLEEIKVGPGGITAAVFTIASSKIRICDHTGQVFAGDFDRGSKIAWVGRKLMVACGTGPLIEVHYDAETKRWIQIARPENNVKAVRSNKSGEGFWYLSDGFGSVNIHGQSTFKRLKTTPWNPYMDIPFAPSPDGRSVITANGESLGKIICFRPESGRIKEFRTGALLRQPCWMLGGKVAVTWGTTTLIIASIIAYYDADTILYNVETGTEDILKLDGIRPYKIEWFAPLNDREIVTLSTNESCPHGPGPTQLHIFDVKTRKFRLVWDDLKYPESELICPR